MSFGAMLIAIIYPLVEAMSPNIGVHKLPPLLHTFGTSTPVLWRKKSDCTPEKFETEQLNNEDMNGKNWPRPPWLFVPRHESMQRMNQFKNDVNCVSGNAGGWKEGMSLCGTGCGIPESNSRQEPAIHVLLFTNLREKSVIVK